MKILVPLKRVVDYNVKVRVTSDGTGADIAKVKMSMNPFDKIAAYPDAVALHFVPGRLSFSGVAA